jgi:hypothetical protein
MQIYRILQIYSILNLVVFLFILQEGEVLEKVGMRAYKNVLGKNLLYQKITTPAL